MFDNERVQTPNNSHQDQCLGAVELTEIVQQLLTEHKMAAQNVPHLITLRRASRSDVRAVDTFAESNHFINKRTNGKSIEDSKEAEIETYMVTAKEVKIITDLIRTKLKPQNEAADMPARSTNTNLRTPTFTEHGLVLGTSTVSESAVSPAAVQLCLGSFHDPTTFLHVLSERRMDTPGLIPTKESARGCLGSW